MKFKIIKNLFVLLSFQKLIIYCVINLNSEIILFYIKYLNMICFYYILLFKNMKIILFLD